MKRLIACLIFVMAIPLAAQQPQRGAAPPPPPPAPQQPARPATPQPPRPAAPQQPVPPPGADATVTFESGGQPVNIRLDITVVDQTAQPKTLMVILADRAAVRIRSAFEDRNINVDGRATIVNGRIRATVTVGNVGVGAASRDLNWNHQFSLLLENGKPTMALETADAANNRKLTIEVKATILK